MASARLDIIFFEKTSLALDWRWIIHNLVPRVSLLFTWREEERPWERGWIIQSASWNGAYEGRDARDEKRKTFLLPRASPSSR